MFKNMMIFMLFSMILTASMNVLADVNNVAKITVNSKVNNVKIHNAMPVIKLALNDVTQLQRIDSTNLSVRNALDKNSASDKSFVGWTATELDKIAPEAWLILGALFCFVMRSNRRTV